MRVLFATSTAEQYLELGKVGGITEVEPARVTRSERRLPAAHADMREPLPSSHTRVWLTGRSRAMGRPATLDAEPDRLAQVDFDSVWFLRRVVHGV